MSIPLSPAACDRLRTTAAGLRGEPDSFYMGSWESCIASRIVNDEVPNVEDAALAALEVGADLAEVVSSALFLPGGWPTEYQLRYRHVGESRHVRNAGLAAELLEEVADKGGLWWIGPPEVSDA